MRNPTTDEENVSHETIVSITVAKKRRLEEATAALKILKSFYPTGN